MADTATSTTPSDPSSTPASDAPVALGNAERHSSQYMELFRAVLGACFSASKDAASAVDSALEAADAAFTKLFKGKDAARADANSPVPEGIVHDRHNPHLDPACPQRLPDADQKPGEPAPVTPPEAAQPDAPAVPSSEQVPASDDPAKTEPAAEPAAEPAPSAPEAVAPEADSKPATGASDEAHDPAFALGGEAENPKS